MTTSVPIPIIGLLVAVAILIFLILRTKVHPLIAMIAAACIAGLGGGMSTDETIASITRGFGSTLGTIGIVIGLGVMMGRILEVSGAAEQIAFSFIRWLGKKREEWALALTGYVVSIPIFVDSAFVILYPVAKALAKKGNRSLLTLGVSLAGGLVVTHTTVPPTPGPLGAAALFGVDVGAMMLLGMVLAIPCTVGIVLYAQWLEKRYPGFTDASETDKSLADMQETYQKDKVSKSLPSLTISLSPIVVPILLIFIRAVIELFDKVLWQNSILSPVIEVLLFLGSPIIALSVSALLAVYLLVPHLNRQETSARLEEGLQSAGIILMVTGAGGALGAVVRDSSIGNQLAEQIVRLPFSPVMIPFIVATLIRFIQGSGTVACVTSATLCAPILAVVPDINMLFAAQSAVMGAFFFSYFNDSLFWVVSKLMGIVDVKQQMMVWSVSTTVAWAIGGISVAILNLTLGSNGSWLDPIVPLAGLAVILLVVKRRT